MASSVGFFAPEFRNKRSGFSDLLRAESLVGNGLLLAKGGELMASFRYQGQDLQVASEGALNRLSLRVNNAMKKLGKGWMVHVNSCRREAQDYPVSGAFPDAVTAAIERERAVQYQAEGKHFANEYVLTFTYCPPMMLATKVKDLLYDNTAHANEMGRNAKIIEYFRVVIGGVTGELEADLGRLTPLLTSYRLDPLSQRQALFDEQLEYLYWCINGIEQPIRISSSAPPVGLDYLLGNQSFVGGFAPKIGRKFIRVVAIEGFVEEFTDVGMLEVLQALPVAYRWSTRWIARDATESRKEAELTRRKWRQKIRGWFSQMTGSNSGMVNQDAVNMAGDSEAAIADISSGDVSYGKWTSCLVLMSENQSELNDSVGFLVKALQHSGFVVRDEEDNAIEAYLGSIPGHGYENVKKQTIHTVNLGHLLPLSSVWQGPTKHPCAFYQKLYKTEEDVPPLFYGAASGGTPFRVVLHNGDLGHTLVIGPTGAGKSTLLGLMAAQHFRYPNARVVGFEKGESMLALCEGAGGQHYAILGEDGDSKIGLCPFQQIHRVSELLWAVDYIAILMELNGKPVDTGMRREIKEAMRVLAGRPVKQRTFTGLAALVQSRDVREVLELYETDMAGGMLNATEETVAPGRFTVFELEQLMDKGDVHVIPVLLYLFRMVERYLDGSPVMIILDEAWLLLKHKLFEEKIREWLKVLRKANALVVFATQELADVVNSNIRDTIYQACQTRILLPNADAQSDSGRVLYRDLGLTDREIELLSYAVAKRDYFFMSPAGRRLFQLELGPMALAFVAASGKEERMMVRDLKRKFGTDWVQHWLVARGVARNDSLFGGRAAA